MIVKTVLFDGDLSFPLAGTLYQVESKPKGVILFNSGTCIRRSFYTPIITYMAEHGYHVLCYDYYGVGDSKTDLREMNRSIYEWGSKDIPSALRWVKHQFPSLKAYIVSHSMGGQILGLSAINGVDKIVTIASSYGHYKNCVNFKRRINTYFGSKTLFPWMTNLYGYFPASKFGMGEDWPKGVAKDWILWNTKYLSLRQWMDRTGRQHHFDKLEVPMISYLLADDDLASPKAKAHWIIDYPASDVRIASPADYNTSVLGHFKTFKSGSERFWDQVLSDLED